MKTLKLNFGLIGRLLLNTELLNNTNISKYLSQDLIDKLNKVESLKFIKIAIIFLVFDTILTFTCISRGKKYEEGIEPQNKVEEIIDKYFGVEYLNNMFNNRWNRK